MTPIGELPICNTRPIPTRERERGGGGERERERERRRDRQTDRRGGGSDLHHEGSVGRGGDATGSKVDDREAPEGLGLPDEVHGGADLLGVDVELVVVHGLKGPDGAHDCAAVTDGLDHVPGASLTLGWEGRSSGRSMRGRGRGAEPARRVTGGTEATEGL